jgi:hypothetical protein
MQRIISKVQDLTQKYADYPVPLTAEKSKWQQVSTRECYLQIFTDM